VTARLVATSRPPSWPDWFDTLIVRTRDTRAGQPSRFAPPPGHRRRSAVLILFGAGPIVGTGGSTGAGQNRSPDAEVLLTERSATMRSHAGQVAFPGGAIDPADAGPAEAALREAQEETGLDPSGVDVAAHLPDLYLPVSDFAVTPVLAWWRQPSPVRVVDPREVARVVRVPVAELLDPENRFQAVHPSGVVGPAFAAGGLFVWGFTAGLLDRVFHLAGWEREWDRERLQSVPTLPDPSQGRSATA
jgi:8-oxo-dGTP pyrophosphatase MutT (NUDIX family)